METLAFFFYAYLMSHRIQVQPFHPFCDDLSWMTQELIEGYIFAWIKGERYGESYVAKHVRGDAERIRLFMEALVDDPDFDDLKEQIWNELELPEHGSLEFHIWQIERHLQDPKLPEAEIAKLYKVLGEFRGWLTKPGDGVKVSNINLNSSSLETIREMNPNDAGRLYAELLNGGV